LADEARELPSELLSFLDESSAMAMAEESAWEGRERVHGSSEQEATQRITGMR